MKKSKLYKLFEEDFVHGDITTRALFPDKKIARAAITPREPGILAGRREVERLFGQKIDIRFFGKDGSSFKKNSRIAELRGDLRKILLYERTVLNLLARMSGVATKTRRIITKATRANPRIRIYATRKTLWGELDKRAVQLGGGGMHRLHLGDAILVKDNHLDALSRDIEACIGKFSRWLEAPPRKGGPKFFEIEVENGEEAFRACRALLCQISLKLKLKLPCFVMFDNFSPRMIAAALRKIRKEGLDGAITGFEASGGITEKNVALYAKTGVDILSMGSLTTDARSLDFSLEMVP